MFYFEHQFVIHFPIHPEFFISCSIKPLINYQLKTTTIITITTVAPRTHISWRLTRLSMLRSMARSRNAVSVHMLWMEPTTVALEAGTPNINDQIESRSNCVRRWDYSKIIVKYILYKWFNCIKWLLNIIK